MSAYKTSSYNEVFALCEPTVRCFDMPLSLVGMELSADDDGLPGAVFRQIGDIVQMIKVSAELKELALDYS